MSRHESNCRVVIIRCERVPAVPTFTTKWSRDGGWSLAKFTTALLAAWCWAVCGARSGCDLKSLKWGTVHTLNFAQGWGCTSFDGGRNKLAGRKKGSRPWSAYFACLCPGGKHVNVPKDFEFSLNEKGNPRDGRAPRYHTYCPLAAMELKSRKTVDGEWRLFTKWTKGYWRDGLRSYYPSSH